VCVYIYCVYNLYIYMLCVLHKYDIYVNIYIMCSVHMFVYFHTDDIYFHIVDIYYMFYTYVCIYIYIVGV
jgi:hypothetical protein